MQKEDENNIFEFLKPPDLQKLGAFASLIDQGLNPIEYRMWLMFMMYNSARVFGKENAVDIIRGFTDEQLAEAECECEEVCEACEEEMSEEGEMPADEDLDKVIEQAKALLNQMLGIEDPQKDDDDEWEEIIH